MALNVDGTLATCDFCGYQWTPRSADPRECPRCKSYYWNAGPPASRKVRA